MKKRNKRGQEGGIGIGTLLLLILGVVGLIVVVVGFTTGWNFITDIFKKADIDVTVISSKCGALASTQPAGYCSDRIEIAKNSYVNCPYAVKELGASIGEVNAPGCDMDDGAKAICNKLKLEEGDKFNAENTRVNNQDCSKWGVSFVVE